MLSLDETYKIRKFLADKFGDIDFDQAMWIFDDYSFEGQDYITDEIEPLSIRNGASKCVLFFKELLKYCVKIPFQGLEYFEWDDEIHNYDDTPNYMGFHYAADIFRGDAIQYRDSVSEWDYCDVESFIAEKAIEWGLGDCFALTFYVGDINHYPIYVAEKVDCTYGCDHYDFESPTYKDSYRRAQEIEDEMDLTIVDPKVFGFFIDNYGEETARKLLDFIMYFRIGDLRPNDNIGFRDGKIKIIDYSDFND
jgi:hypothetical protein